MLNFDYQNKTRIIFGRGEQGRVGELIRPHTDSILLHYGGESAKKSGLLDQVTSSLRASGIEYFELGGVKPNPRLALVREGVAMCRGEGIGFILAVGGGSVIDSAKAIAMGVPYNGDVWDFYEKKIGLECALPVAAVLTIPASGSESSVSSVITNEDKGLKLGYNHELLRPVFSVINPECFFTLPAEQMACGVCDMMSHILERYFTKTTRTDLIDGLCESVLRTVMRSARVLLREPGNYDSWAELGYAGTLAHNNLLGVGRAQDWACHGMEHELSAIYDVPHGAGLAVLTPSWMRYVYRENLPMFVQFAVNVMGVDGSLRDFEAVASEGIDRLEAFFAELGLPVTMRGLGIGEDKLELMAKRAAGPDSHRKTTLGAIKKLGWEDVLNIYRLAR